MRKQQTGDTSTTAHQRGDLRAVLGVILLASTAAMSLFADSLTWTVNMTGPNGATLKGSFVYDSVSSSPTQAHPEVLNPILTVTNLYFADPTYQSGAREHWVYQASTLALIQASLDAWGGAGGVTNAGSIPFNIPPNNVGNYPEIFLNTPGLSLAGGGQSVSATVSEKDGLYLQSFPFSGTLSAPTPVTISAIALSNGVSGTSVNFTFTNLPGFSGQFTVWGSTNVATPTFQWSNLGHPTETAAGFYQFADALATNRPARFYRVGTE